MIVRQNNLGEIVANLAVSALSSGTFGVGGVLVDSTGAVIKEMQNAVVLDGRVSDPTAHVERQLIDWFFKYRSGENPSGFTIVSSLEPCLMCGASILASGFKVVSMSRDPFAGIDYSNDGSFSCLPIALKERASNLFHYAESLNLPLFGTGDFTREECERALGVFVSSIEPIKARISNSGFRDPEQLVNPSTFFRYNNLGMLEEIRKQAPEFLTVTDINLDRYGQNLAPILLQVADQARQNGAQHNAVALIDPFGNLLMVRGGNEHQSPIRTAFMELTRAYAKLRFDLGPQGEEFLTHPKFCTFLMLKGPGDSASDLANLGAFGSTMEGPVANPNCIQYVLPTLSKEALTELLRNMPPLYKEVIKINPLQVANPDLISACNQ